MKENWIHEKDQKGAYHVIDTEGPIAIAEVGVREDHAALLAASPDLLRALEQMVEWAKFQKTTKGGGFSILREARQAIAKAKGELLP